VNTDRRPRALTVAFAVLFAAAFFFAGYVVRTATTAMAAIPIASPTPVDGNPSGHHLNPNYAAAMSGPTVKKPTSDEAAQLKNCLHRLAAKRLTIWYVTAKPGQQPHLRAPTCQSIQVCAPITWKFMSITTWKPNPDYSQNGTETVDVYGIIAVQ
jgi:hypothetical protein